MLKQDRIGLISISQTPLYLSLLFTIILFILVDTKVNKQMHFCERLSVNSTFNQPINSFSNISYILVGFYISVHSAFNFKKKHNRFCKTPCYSIFLASLAISQGYTSMYYHGFNRDFYVIFDTGSTICIFAFFLSLNVTIIMRNKSKLLFSFLVAIISSIGFAFLVNLVVVGVNFMLTGLPVLYFLSSILIHALPRYSHVRPTNALHYLFSSLFLLLVSSMLWLNSYTAKGILCDPDSIWQPHAAFHVGTSLSIALLYMYHFHEEEILSQ